MFGIGYGSDTIYEYDYSGKETVIFGKGITADMLSYVRNEDDLVISIKGTNDTLTITEQYSSNYNQVENFTFVDGTILSSDDFFSKSVINGSGTIKDFTNGYGTRDSKITGSDEDDEIYAYSGNDILDGKAGNDYLEGGSGNDTYLFGIGYGNDTIYENDYSGKETVIFGEGITPEMLSHVRNGDDLVISIKGTNDTLTITEQYSSNYNQVENFLFADGKTMTSDDIFSESTINGSGKIEDFKTGYGTRNSTIIGSNHNDQIYAYSGNDILDGKAGNDYLEGGSGNDTYLFGIGYGNDTIFEDNYYDKDAVAFGEGIAVSSIEMSKDGDDLVLSIIGEDDSLRITSYFKSMYNMVEFFVFKDGTITSIDKNNLCFIIDEKESDQKSIA